MTSITDYLSRHDSKPLLRFITCGSVDDGKSTLIGRLLHDSKHLFEDQIAALEMDSLRHGTQGAHTDYALLLDGLEAEREQGITIDVAYRFFDTDKRKFIVADCPGHEQYTRNMATGASTADLATVLIDARKGLLPQTRRHSYIASLFGIRHVVLAVNKMDLVDYDADRFNDIAKAYRILAGQFGIDCVQCIPLSALKGDNLIARSANMPWYTGPSLLEHLETVETASGIAKEGLRLPIQWVNRPNQDFRGFSGTIAAGEAKPGDEVMVLPSARRSTIKRVFDGSSDVTSARTGQAITITLADDIDIGRGDIIASASDSPEVSDQFSTRVLCMSDAPLLPGRPYWLKIGTRTTTASITEIKYRIDTNTQNHLAAKRLELNEVGCCNLWLDEPIAFEPYAKNRTLGSFILIDRQSNDTVAAGVIDFALRRASNVHWQHVDIDKNARAQIKGQSPKVLWFTGLSGAGKSTVANLVDRRLHALGYHSFILDGDNIRHGLSRDLGFTDEDRVENIRRIAEVAKLMVDAGLIVLVSFISPFRAERRMARNLFSEGEFIEIFVDIPLAVAESRDPKGLYLKARSGEVPNFTGIDSPYEAPEHPELHLDAVSETPETMAKRVLEKLYLQ